MCTGCITEETQFAATPRSTFEALWQTLDQHYCFFSFKGIDWNDVHRRYEPLISDTMKREALFDTLANMTYELRDGHVNLYSAMNTCRYGAWFDDYPMNFSDSLLHKTLGRSGDYRSSSGMAYRIIEGDSIGYLRVGSFEGSPSVSAMSEMLYYFRNCPALIIDVRSNGGGMLTAAQALASSFIKERTLIGYMQHKTGPGHGDFSTPEPIYLNPSQGSKWLRPVVVLTNRRTYSAANAFVMYMHPLPHVVTFGDRTGGGSGLPFSTELPNGWGIRFSASPMLTPEKEHTEFGIAPDRAVNITSRDYQRSYDTILEAARSFLHQYLSQRNQQSVKERVRLGE